MCASLLPRPPWLRADTKRIRAALAARGSTGSGTVAVQLAPAALPPDGALNKDYLGGQRLFNQGP
jgi:hypothetical protein